MTCFLLDRAFDLFALFLKFFCTLSYFNLELFTFLSHFNFHFRLSFGNFLFGTFEVIIAFLVLGVRRQTLVFYSENTLIVNSANSSNDEHRDVVPKLLLKLVLDFHVFVETEYDIFFVWEATKEIGPTSHKRVRSDQRSGKKYRLS